SGHISDMETTLQGDTRELSEIDRIFLEFKKGDFRALAGDFTVETDNSILLESNKQVKGVSLSLDKDEKRGGVFAAYSGSEHAQERIYGEAGYQGPYFLEGDGRRDFIQPVDGSVRVYSKGEELQEGKDYRVDYLQGAVTFSPGFVLEDDQLITVDYEYGIYDYRRRAGGGSFHLSSPDSVIAVTGNIIAESDNKDNPLGLEMDEDLKERAKEAGDRSIDVSSARYIEKADVDNYSAWTPLYAKEDTAGSAYYRYVPEAVYYPDSLYAVWFSKSEQGSYIRDTVDYMGNTLNVYRYAGEGRGDYTYKTDLVYPERKVKGAGRVDFSPAKGTEFTLEAAGMERDENLFSERDDSDNTSSSLTASFGTDREMLSITGDWYYKSERFIPDINKAYIIEEEWDIRADTVSGSENIWSGGLGFNPGRVVNIDLKGGQYVADRDILSGMAGYTISLFPDHQFSALYTGSLVSHGGGRHLFRRDRLSLKLITGRVEQEIYGRDEWREKKERTNTGGVGCGYVFRVNPGILREEVSYHQGRKGGSSIYKPQQRASADTSGSLVWTQEFNWEPLSVLNISGNTHLQTEEVNDSSRLFAAADIKTALDFERKGLYADLRYYINYENASKWIQIPSQVGEGLGTYSYDTLAQEYVEDPGGEWVIQEREIYDSAGSHGVRKNYLSGRWFFSPPDARVKGILRDLSWEGEFRTEEHILEHIEGDKGGSGFPGYLSLFKRKRNEDVVTYSDVWYRQRVNWYPGFTPGMEGSLSFRPYRGKKRDKWRDGIEIGAGLDKRWGDFRGGLEGVYVYERQEDVQKLYDRHVVLEERYYLLSDVFSVYLKEKVGSGERLRQDGEDMKGWYYAVTPGISFTKSGTGYIEADYTYSEVEKGLVPEYPVARGMATGVTQSIYCSGSINMGENFVVRISYTGRQEKEHSKRWFNSGRAEVRIVF
ncbi:MAG: hypothetical protein ACOCSE_01550, partial [Chitinivibrionales bacterium]